MRPRYAIVAPPRSGTGYASALLTAAGLDCGHETYWRLAPPPDRAHLGDSSWLALPDLERDRDEVVVFALLRDPRDVVSSIAYGELWTEPARRFLQFAANYSRIPADASTDAGRIEWATRFSANWLVRTVAIADYVLDLDALHPDQVAEPLGLERVPVAQYPPTDTNARGDHPALSWSDLGTDVDTLRTIWEQR